MKRKPLLASILFMVALNVGLAANRLIANQPDPITEGSEDKACGCRVGGSGEPPYVAICLVWYFDDCDEDENCPSCT